MLPFPDRLIDWKVRATWHDAVSAWINAEAEADVVGSVAALGEQDLCWDDPTWLEQLSACLDFHYEGLLEPMADWLSAWSIRVYHGGRVEDAACYARHGLLRSRTEALDAQVRRIVGEEDDLAWMRPGLDERLAAWPRRNRDDGWLHVAIDGRVQHDEDGSSSHYMLYGSEWIFAFLGPPAWPVLRRRGVATMAMFDLPLAWVSPQCREEFAEALLQEWCHATVNRRDWTPARDWTFSLQFDLPPETYVGHSHPRALVDTHGGGVSRRQREAICPSCFSQPTPVASNG